MKEKILEIITDILQVEPGAITEDTMTSDLEEWDSLAQVMIIGEIEAKLSIKISLDEAMEVEGVRDILKLCNA